VTTFDAKRAHRAAPSRRSSPTSLIRSTSRHWNSAVEAVRKPSPVESWIDPWRVQTLTFGNPRLEPMMGSQVKRSSQPGWGGTYAT
jgi:hypothetical protein